MPPPDASPPDPSDESSEPTTGQVALDEGEVDLDTRRVRGRGDDVQLSETESRLLYVLAQSPGEPVAAGVLLEQVWGLPADSASRTLFATMQRLRSKIERDPSSPRHLVTLRGRGYAYVPPATAAVPLVRSSPAPPPSGHLPPTRGRWIGRREELAAVEAVLADSVDVVTVRGPGGAGKTRLALQVAHGVSAGLSGGVWWCSLAGVHDEAGVLEALCATAGIATQLSAPDRLLRRLGRVWSAQGTALVVLDDAEVAADAVRSVLDRWLEHRPRLLITSRVPIGVRDERVVLLGPLSLPEASDPGDAVALLRDRIAARNPGWGDDDDSSLARIASALGGLPLALELAAGWAGVLTPVEMAARVEEAPLAVESAEGRAGRHGSLTACIEGSWALLDPVDRSVLAGLSVFEGPFSAARATAVLDVGEPLPAIARLEAASLVSPAQDAGLQLLPSIRAFAAARLAREPERRHHLLRRHAAAFAELAEVPCRTQADRTRRRTVLRDLRVGAENGAPEDSARCGLAASDLYRVVGPLSRMEEMLRAALTHEVPAALRVRLLWQLSIAVGGQGEAEESLALVDEALTLARAEVPEKAPMLCLRLGSTLNLRGDARGAELLDEAAAAMAAAGNEEAVQLVRAERVGTTLRSDPAGAEQVYLEVLAELRRLGGSRYEALYLTNLAVARTELGALEEAEGSLRRAVDLARQQGNVDEELLVLVNLGYVLGLLLRLDDAEAELRRGQRLARSLGRDVREAQLLGNLAAVTLDRHVAGEPGQLAAAEALLDEADALVAGGQQAYREADLLLDRARLARLRGRLDRAEVALDEVEVRAAQPPVSAARPLLALERAALAAERGQTVEARSWLTEARAGLAPLSPAHTRRIERVEHTCTEREAP